MTIRALIFDFDGLILDTETPLHRSWMEIYEEAGLTVTPETWAELLGSAADPPGAYDLLEKHLGRPLDRAAVRQRHMKREHELLRQEVVLPGVCRLLNAAEQRGLSRGIASSSDRRWVVGHLRRVGLFGSFDAIVCADDVSHTKPSPDLYLEAVHRLGVRPSEAIAFEDSMHGVKAAKRAGLFCVAVPNQITRHLSFDEADLVLKSLADRSLDDYIEAATAFPS